MEEKVFGGWGAWGEGNFCVQKFPSPHNSLSPFPLRNAEAQSGVAHHLRGIAGGAG